MSLPTTRREWRDLFGFAALGRQPPYNGNTEAAAIAAQGETAWNAWTGWGEGSGRQLYNPNIPATAKPTWAQLSTLPEEDALFRYFRDGGIQSRHLARAEADAPAPVAQDVSLGLDVSLQGRRIFNDEGGHIHRTVAVDANDDGTVSYYRTPEALEAAIDAEREATLRQESGRAIVRAQIEGYRAIGVDTTKTLAERTAAMNSAKALLVQTAYDAALAAALLTLDADPTDADEFRLLAIHRIEAAGVRRRQWVLGTSSRQGDWLDSSCAEQRTALDEISNHVQRAVLEFQHLTTTARMALRETAWIGAINAITVSGAAEWRDTFDLSVDALGNSYAATFDVDATKTTQRVAKLYVTDPRASGELATAILSVETSDADLTWAFDQDGARSEIVFTYNGSTVPAAITVKLTGRSTCGPTDLVATFTARAKA